MRKQAQRAESIIQLYLNEHGGSVEESARDIITDIYLYLYDRGSEADVKDALRMAWANYEYEMREVDHVAN